MFGFRWETPVCSYGFLALIPQIGEKKMNKLKRLVASLVLCATLVALALPVSAKSSFSDITDTTTAVNADILRLMGVVSGSGGNNFSPNSYLTRAEFCVMAVMVLGRGDEVPLYTTRTIFSDVTASHWARGYVNLASSITVGDSESGAGNRLISGVGTGQFKPNDKITYAQAVTILIRMLGYGDDKVGAVWPASYLNMAVSLGLNAGVSASSSAPITRAQAAQLFANLLSAKTSGGQKFYETLGSCYENVMLLAVNVTANDKTPGAIRTSKGIYLPAVEGVIPTALQGRRGTLVLDEHNKIVTFIPDSSTAVNVTLSGDAQATYLKDTSGTRYPISSTTPAFTSISDDVSSTYADLWVDLRSGSQVTLFLDGGQVIGVYYAAGGISSTEAYVVTGKLNSASFHQITGGATNYTIKKNNEVIGLSDVKLYDVATYDSLTNTVVISDLRLTCVYEHADPNPTTPETITVLGHDFPVLETALESISQFKIGQTVALLLTADGKVAGMVEPSADARTTATGLAGSSSVFVDLPNGGTIELKGSIPESAQDRVVTVSASKGDKISVSRVSSTSIPGDFDIENMTLGSYTVSAGVKVYEQIDGSAMVAMSLADLEYDSIPKNQLYAYRLNSSGMVDVIILNSVTGDAYTYGILRKGEVSHSLGDLTATNTTVSVENGSGGMGEIITGAAFQDRTFGGTVAGVREIGGTKVAVGVVTLQSVSGVRRSDFFQKDGLWYVNAGGTVYQVSSKVEGYIKATGVWFDQNDTTLETIRKYSDDMTVYIDPVGHKVRIIEVN